VVLLRAFGHGNRDPLHPQPRARRQRRATIAAATRGLMEPTVRLRRYRKGSKTCEEVEGRRSRPLPGPRRSSHFRSRNPLL
jgi:hypothetical protein